MSCKLCGREIIEGEYCPYCLAKIEQEKREEIKKEDNYNGVEMPIFVNAPLEEEKKEINPIKELNPFFVYLIVDYAIMWGVSFGYEFLLDKMKGEMASLILLWSFIVIISFIFAHASFIITTKNERKSSSWIYMLLSVGMPFFITYLSNFILNSFTLSTKVINIINKITIPIDFKLNLWSRLLIFLNISNNIANEIIFWLILALFTTIPLLIGYLIGLIINKKRKKLNI